MKIKELEKIRMAELGLLVTGGMLATLPKGITIQDLNSGLSFIEQSGLLQNTYEHLFEIRNGLPSSEVIALLSSTPFYLDFFFGSHIEKQTSDYKQLSTLYNEALDRTSNLIKQFALDEPISVFAMYVYLYRNGYLSHNHQFTYSFGLKDMPGIIGTDVIGGSGVCRSISAFLTDLYQKLGYSSANLTVYTQSATCKSLEHLCPTELAKQQNAGKIVKVISALTGTIRIGNHMITDVTDGKRNYVLDPTNDGILYAEGSNLIVPNNPALFMKYKPFTLGFNRTLGQVNDSMSLTDIKTNLQRPSIDIEEYRKIYLETLKLVRDNQDILDQFYQESAELYADVENILHNQNNVIKRKLPIIPKIKIK